MHPRCSSTYKTTPFHCIWNVLHLFITFTYPLDNKYRYLVLVSCDVLSDSGRVAVFLALISSRSSIGFYIVSRYDLAAVLCIVSALSYLGFVSALAQSRFYLGLASISSSLIHSRNIGLVLVSFRAPRYRLILVLSRMSRLRWGVCYQPLFQGQRIWMPFPKLSAARLWIILSRSYTVG